MAFQLSVDPNDLSFDYLQKGSIDAVLTMIGYDDNAPKVYALSVSLDPLVGYEDDHKEFNFVIMEYDGETGAEHIFWHSQDVATFISKEDRTAILGVLLAAVNHLLALVKPCKVEMCSMEAHAPKFVNRKFIAIARVFEANGYAIKMPDPFHGQTIWNMER